MRRIILLCVVLQSILISAVCGQDDSSGVKLPPVQTTIIKDSSISKPAQKKTIPVKVVKPSQVLLRTDSIPMVQKDTLVPGFLPYGSAVRSYVMQHPYYNTGGDVVYMPSQRYSPDSKDELFYILCGTLFFLGILRVGFPKYFQDVFNVFWKSAFRQKQIRDQLQQAGMTTLLFNIFFVFSTALFSYLVIEYTANNVAKPWLLFAICFFSIALIYCGKYFILKLMGWMFGQPMAADSYIFIVFLVNKILSILLIPLMLVLAFGDPVFQQIAFTVSIILLGFLLIYRFILYFSVLRNELKISLLHLVLYVCGFEIIPVLLIYKLLLHLFGRSS
ncbi:DUF4271 domain-containing protein [Agriterribacter humi]|uniref:DUF4271 domain-containing protein n=1 Tax=Agriterribacter humi TaxID=1104781 RepID=UPI001264438A|nr:DUF4271 domain-containing protein [Agriterribacter humi]